MTLRNLSKQSLLELIDLFERSHTLISNSDGQHLHGVPGWDFLSKTNLSANELTTWTECAGYAGCYPAYRGDELVPVDIEEDEDPNRYRYQCPTTFRSKYVVAQEVTVYSVPPPKLLLIVADLLDIPQTLRKDIDSPLLGGVLWFLGKARINTAHVDIWLVRGLAQHTGAIFQHFHAQALPDQGLILSSGRVFPNFVSPPRNYRFAALRDIFVDATPAPQLDIELLHRILTAPEKGTLEPVLPVHFDEYTNTLTIRGKDKRWHIKGARQAAAIKYMFEQFKHGRCWLAASEILDAAYPDKTTGKSRKIGDLFRGNTEWRDFIANPQKGQYGFLLE